jgi:hypothetical protein
VSRGSCLVWTRWRSIERDTLERDQFDMATTSVHVRLQQKQWWRCDARSERSRLQEQGSKGPKPLAGARLKGSGAATSIKCRAHNVEETLAHVRVPRCDRPPPTRCLDSH